VCGKKTKSEEKESKNRVV